jgi:hypothetical protein
MPIKSENEIAFGDLKRRSHITDPGLTVLGRDAVSGEWSDPPSAFPATTPCAGRQTATVASSSYR